MARSPKALHLLLNAILTEYRTQIALFEALKSKFNKANEQAQARIEKLDERIESLKKDAYDEEDEELINEDIGEAIDWLDNYAVHAPTEMMENDIGTSLGFESALSHLRERVSELEAILESLPEDCFVLVRDEDEDDEDEDDEDDEDEDDEDDEDEEPPPPPPQPNGGRSSGRRPH